MSKLWGGRFTSDVDALMERFNASFPFDRRLYREDIEGSLAYARAIERAGVLTPEESRAIQDGLRQVLAEFEAGTFVEGPGDEDIHTAVERRLRELIGPVAEQGSHRAQPQRPSGHGPASSTCAESWTRGGKSCAGSSGCA